MRARLRIPIPTSHWQIQIVPLQALRRWLFTRCAECGERFPYGHSPVSHSWDSPRRTFWERWTQGEPGLYHQRCSTIVSIRRKRDDLAQPPTTFNEEFRLRRERTEPGALAFNGCYPWWRVAVLGEDPVMARERAASHVQREYHPCSRCKGEGCEACEDTGYPRHTDPIPASAI